MEKIQKPKDEASAAASSPKKIRLEETDLREKFEGCLLGALAGDCLGARFEFSEDVGRNDVVDYINSMCREMNIPPSMDSDRH